MGRIARDLWAFLAGRDPAVHPKTRLGRALPLIGAVLGLLCGLIAYQYYLGNVDGTHWMALLVASILVAAPISLVATRPLLAWRIAWVTAIYTGIMIHIDQRTPWPWQPVQVMSYPLILAVVAIRHRRGVVIWTGISALLLVISYIPPSNVAGLLLLVVAILVVGDQIRRRREVQRALVEEEERSELAQARRAIAEERNRIAREMHDVVAHHMSLIAVRAETAVYRIEGVPPAVAEELSAIAGTSREALVEMRRLLGVLRNDSEPLTEPQPVLDDLVALVRGAREAGVQVDFSPLPGMPVPPGVGLAAFRIVQEALSNARRHAAGAPVTIAISREKSDLVVLVRNEPTPPQALGQITHNHPNAADVSPRAADVSAGAADVSAGAADVSRGRGRGGGDVGDRGADVTPRVADVSAGAADVSRGGRVVSPRAADVSEVAARGSAFSASGTDVSGSGADIRAGRADVTGRGADVNGRGADVNGRGADVNGRGADVDQHGGRHGLLGMRERAAAVGGTLRVGPADDGGFEVLATLPLNGPGATDPAEPA